MNKARRGNFFEDFALGQIIRHATPRTITDGDISLYTALYGTRFAVQSSAEFAKRIGYPGRPVDDLLVFHIVFGKTVPDISLNAIANLGYAECLFLEPVYAGDTLSATSEVIGLKENSSGETGTVYVRSAGRNQHGEIVLEFIRWVMVRKADPRSPPPEPSRPSPAPAVEPARLGAALPPLAISAYDFALAGSEARFGDYRIGERIDHIDGMTIEEAEHQLAARLYQNNAKVHFNRHSEAEGRFGKRLVYGGHIISLARALSFNGLENAFHIAAINDGRHAAPAFAGDTVYAWSEVLDKAPLASSEGFGALRLRTVALKDRSAENFPLRNGETYDPALLLDLDYWAILPR